MKKADSDKDINTLFFRISAISGRISRIINHYEGDKVKKANEPEMCLGTEVSRLQYHLVLLANSFHINLFDSVDKVLEKSAERDKNRFMSLHDPVTELSLERFNTVIETNDCLNKKKIWGSCQWIEHRDFESNLTHSLPSFLRFTKSAKAEGLDGYVFEIQDTSLANDENGLQTAASKLVSFLSEHNPVGQEIRTKETSGEERQFSYNGIRFFLTTFASFYSKGHPRHSPVKDSFFILLQSEFSMP
ncbi:hypothetical protein [Sediminibacillus albus]|uniref:YD repeat-containing protein n=1 Tax=Sediminibacillus albus TaxID=407036 RepID=A0A1G8X7B8_9BACI|nr:hypothetical protein [Sediminibacillus albus]SDJ85745.1 YD repeat-containing protein [Sediminibacillus albus]